MTGRHHGRRLVGKCGGELLSHQRQQRGIGKMEQHDAKAEDDQRPGFEHDPVAGRPGCGLRHVLLSVEVSRPVVINRLGRNGEHRDAGNHREDRHEKQYGALRERIANPARHHGNGDIARMVKGRVPSHAPRQLAPRVQAQRHGGDSRTEEVADDCSQAGRQAIVRRWRVHSWPKP
jgi:hypothetical protein